MCSSCSMTNCDCCWCSGFRTVSGCFWFLRARARWLLVHLLSTQRLKSKGTAANTSSERDAVQPAPCQAQPRTTPAASLYSSDTSGTWLEAATVITTFRDLPFHHTALTEIQHDEMTVPLVPDKLFFKRILYKKNLQMNLPFLSQLLVITSLLDSSAWRASLTYCEQGPGEYNYEQEHHKENNDKRL